MSAPTPVTASTGRRAVAGTVVVVGATVPWSLLGTGLRVRVVPNPAHAARVAVAEDAALVVTLPEVRPASAVALLRQLAADLPDRRRFAVVTCAGPDLEPFADVVDVLHYLSVGPLDQEALGPLVAAALGVRPPVPAIPLADRARALARVRAALPELAASATPADLAQRVEALVRALLPGTTAACLSYDADRDLVVRHPGLRADPREDSPCTGLVGFAVRTRSLVAADADDPRFDPAVDVASGPVGPWLGAPLVAGEVVGVVVAHRPPSAAPFSPEDRAALALLAEAAAGPSQVVHAIAAAEDAALREANPLLAERMHLFRPEAVAAYRRGMRGSGAILRLGPEWVRPVGWLLVAATVAALGFATLATVDERASGPAVVRSEGCTDLVATGAGVVRALRVAPGDAVGPAQAVVELHASEEAARYERARQQFELELARYLRDPADVGVRDRLATLRSERDYAQALLGERSVATPHEGVVGDVRVRPGQRVAAGDLLATVCGADASYSLVALLPGADRPQLERGLELRFAVDGYRASPLVLAVDSVGDGVVEPSAAWRYVGQDPPSGATAPVALVGARIGDPTFEHRGRTLGVHDGMRGTAEVVVARRSLLRALLPALEGRR